ncbi:hypothetical protein PC116_g31480 [Phytophthora cactorum]|nr:hypothetical protein PC116_g31480 [Phytophthora cactorum]
MVVQLPDLEECRVALPLSAYSSRKLVEKGKDFDWKFSGRDGPEALWRDISAAALSPSLEDSNRKLTGYWIVMGKKDMRPPPSSKPQPIQ